MALYSSREALDLYLAGDPRVQRHVRGMPDDQVEGLLMRGQWAVDNVVGEAWERDPETGLRFPEDVLDTLTDGQRQAISNSCCAYVEWLVIVGTTVEAGDSVEAPGQLTTVRAPAEITPKLVGELAGYGLLKRTATASPSPPPAGHPWAEEAGCVEW
jgi:hypothetical protein